MIEKDPLLSGTLFFPLRPGKNWIGSSFATVDPPSIQLTGLMIEDKHCVIDVSEELKLTARAETYVNGHFIDTHDVVLHHGDRIIIGGAHYFHLHHPKDCKIHEKQSVSKVSLFYSFVCYCFKNYRFHSKNRCQTSKQHTKN